MCRPQDIGPDAITFEAWVSSSDFCHASALMSYALDSKSDDMSQRTADFNHFVVRCTPKPLIE